jgi:hypothetical protein
MALWEATDFHKYLGLQQNGMMRYVAGGREEFALHPSVLSALMNADWRLASSLDAVEETPVCPSVVPRAEINTALYDNTDARFSTTPLCAPQVAGIKFASRKKWLLVQRGMMQAMEELARAAIVTHSSLAHGWEEVQKKLGAQRDPPQLFMAFETLLSSQTALLVELVHHLVYAHRMAYARGCEEPLRHEVLSQPVFDKQELFNVSAFRLLDLENE